jgi:hypothetical protein
MIRAVSLEKVFFIAHRKIEGVLADTALLINIFRLYPDRSWSVRRLGSVTHDAGSSSN